MTDRLPAYVPDLTRELAEEDMVEYDLARLDEIHELLWTEQRRGSVVELVRKVLAENTEARAEVERLRELLEADQKTATTWLRDADRRTQSLVDETHKLREEHAADRALWAAEEARITDERAALVRQLEDARSDFESTEYDLARLVVAVREAIRGDGSVCSAAYPRGVRALAEDIAENGRAGWIEEALTDDHERRVQARETRTRELVREVERLRAEAEGAITLSDEQMAAVRAVLSTASDMYYEDASWEQLRRAIQRWHDLGAPLSEGER